MHSGAVTAAATATGRVAILTAPGRIDLQREPVPSAPPGGVVVRVRAALTDGTDLKTYRRGHPKMPFPTRFGHEFSGDVAAVGEGTVSFSAGDAIACAHSAPCGTCYWCSAGEPAACESVVETMVLGAYADYVALPRRIVQCNAYRKPAGVPYEEAAFLEPLSCVMHSLAVASPANDATVAIVGDGAFGLMHALELRRRGIAVVVLGRRPERLSLARELGLDAVDTRAQPDREALFERTDGRGADVLIECTATAAVWERAPDLVRRGGVVALFGGLPAGTRVTFDAARLHYDGVRIVAPFHFAPTDVREAFDAIGARALPLQRLISGTVSLDDIGAAFARLDLGEGMKMLVRP